MFFLEFFMKVLTKSNYIIGLECPKFLWEIFNNPKRIRKELSLADQFKFDEGGKVGEMAKKLFPDGISLPQNYRQNIKETKNSLSKKRPLFEAGFEFSGCFSRADILIPNEDKWDIIEVKSGTSVKDINLHDLAFQKYVYERNELKIGRCFLLHLNNNYKRNGELNLKELFENEDVTEEVNKISKEIEKTIEDMFKIISLKKSPKAGIFTQSKIKNGYHDCLVEGCVSLPDNNVFCLYRGGKLSCELLDGGIEAIKDIPDEVELNIKQSIQKECEITKKSYINKEEIKMFLEQLKYPIYYLDFETFRTAIPMFDGLKPYSQVPFQFSIHIIKEKGTEPEHHAFLYKGDKDPRKDFTFALKNLLGENGTVLVYNQTFEVGRLKELAENMPSYKKWVDSTLNRVVDLLVPFREFSYYNSIQQGSASIKKVLPALCNVDYSGMEIEDGVTASIEFFRVTYNDCSKEERDEVRENLLKYCELDTLAEVMIVEKLMDLAK